MAGLMLEPRLRPCYITKYKKDPERRGRLVKDGEVKALFHCWEHSSEVVSPSAMMGGHNGGVVSCIYAIVESEDGKMFRIPIEDIRFVDHIHEQYAFNEALEHASKLADALYLEDLRDEQLTQMDNI